MGFITYLILIALSGIFVGALGRLLIPGRDPMSLLQTMLVGIAGSLIAGLIVYAAYGRGHAAGILLSVLCAAVIVYIVRRSRGGTLTRPAPRDGLFGRRRDSVNRRP
jgi:uncharacterized membrane protein YeaQ/YmgE (transglycosylase-associated protein family)